MEPQILLPVFFPYWLFFALPGGRPHFLLRIYGTKSSFPLTFGFINSLLASV